MLHRVLPALRPLGFLLLGLLPLSCGGGGSGGPPFGLSQRTPLGALAFPGIDVTVHPVDLVQAFPNLSFTRPVFLTAALSPSGTPWIFVVEQDGTIEVFANDDAVASISEFLDIQAAVSTTGSEEGLLGLAFDPDFGTSGHEQEGVFYVHYSAASPRRSVISRFRATFPPSGPPQSSSVTEEIVLEVDQPFSNHNGGMLAFGPDALLYVALGDGGSSGDPGNHAQDLSTLLGSLLRIDVRNPPAGESYGIPGDNPFLNVTGAAPEIYAYGLRNPWRFSFDRGSGRLWVGDVGQGDREEIDLVESGQNLGWRFYEGNLPFDNPTGIPPSAFTPPVVDYGRNLGGTVIGGYVYRGQDVPSLSGVYVYGDYVSGRIWGLRHDGTVLLDNAQIESLLQLVSLGEDERGELYAVSHGGAIYRFTEPPGTPPAPPFPDLLSETGLFVNLATLAPTAGLLEYEVNSELWSDGARKRRWIGLPGQSRLVFSPSAPYAFPLGAVLVKHFELDGVIGAPGGVRRLETRVLLNTEDGWAGYTYRWNDAQTDAVLLADALSEPFDVADPAEPGGVRVQVWRYPSRTDCLRCHTPAAGFVLGVRTGQINRSFDFPEATDNQIRTWNHIGLFSGSVGDPSLLEAWPDPADPAAGSVTSRARSYLAANCAQCHLPLGPAPTNLDLRWTTPRDQMGAIDVRPENGNLGLTDPWIVRPAHPEQSVLWLRMDRLDGTRMPPLASLRVHDAAVDLLEEWILNGAP